MNYKITDTLEGIQELKEEWVELYNQLPELSPFQSYEFNYYSWEHFLKKEGQLFVLSFYETNQLVAIFPTYIDRSKTLRFINDIHVDFCNILNISSSSFKLFKLFEKIVSDSKQVREVKLSNIKDGKTASQLNYHFKKRKSLNSSIQHSLLEIQEDGFTHLNSSERSELKRIQKKLKDCVYEEWGVFKENVIDLVRSSMLDSKLRNDDFLSASFIKLLKVLFEAKQLRIFSLNLNEKVVAISFIITRGKHQLVWMDAYDDTPYVNLSNYIHFLEKQEPGVIVSFGRGTYKYKMNNFQPLAENLYSFYYSKSLFLFTLNELEKLLKAVLKSVVREKQY
jgi:hypothetical protein